MAELMKKVKTTVGSNVRIGDDAYNDLREFCKERGYNIGGFVERASLEAMEKERKAIARKSKIK